ncbi:MAG: hypothetical protein ABSF53_11935 [Terracidiphilus sp.]
MSHNSKYCLLPLAVAALLAATASRQASASEITVGSPVSGMRVSSPVMIKAHNVGCNGARPTYFGYSIDDDRAIVPGRDSYDIDVFGQSLAAGPHTLHFRSWTSEGECPEVTTTFTVQSPKDPTTKLSIPPDAVSSGSLDGSSRWVEGHDGGTPGKSEGWMLYPAKTPLYDDAREFMMTYTERAGERWSTFIVQDTVPTHFALDLYVMFPNPSEVRNLEMDINQVLANGDTIIMSTQCSGEIGFWEYGDTKGDQEHWKSTKLPCNPATWKANVWHHVQIGEHHDGLGNVTHDWVTLDGDYTPFVDATLPSVRAEDWEIGNIATQFQIEGSSLSSGKATAYVHDLTVYRW